MSGTGRAKCALLAGAAAALAALAPCRLALAQEKLQATGDATVGFSDNIESAPDVPTQGSAPKYAGAFLVLRPGVVLASVSSRSIHRLKYTYSYDLLFEHVDASTSTNQLEYRGFFDLSPRAGLVTNAAVIQSNGYSSIILTAPGAGAVDAVSAGSINFLNASADELLSVDLAPGLRGYQGAALGEQTPLFDTVAPRTFLGSARLGGEHTFLADAIGAEARGEYTVVEGSLAPDGTALGTQNQLVATGVAVWRHDWGRDFTSRAEAGAFRVQRLNTGRGLWGPAGRATLAYVQPFGDAELSYDHMVTTNPLIGQTLLIDQVRLRGALPLTKKRELLVAASAGYQWGQILDPTMTPADHVDAILADVALGWQVHDMWLLGLRYQHVQQISDVQVPPLPVSFVRNSVMATVAFRFPPEKEMPRAYRAPQRVDGADEIRDGLEPPENRFQQPAGTTGR